jgi:carboxypeptidase D
MDWLNEKHVECGYADFMETALAYPPTGILPSAPDPFKKGTQCNLWDYALSAAM